MKKYNYNILQMIKIFSFIITFYFIFLFLEYYTKPNSVDLQNISGFYGERKNSLDAVYIGGSACFVYWEPLKAWEDNGIVSYSFAANTIQAEFYQYMIKEILKYQDPKVIIIDARAFQYRDYEMPPTEVAYRNVLTGTPFSVNRFNFIENNVPKYLDDSTLSYHFDIIKYHSAGITKTWRNSLKMMSGNYHNHLKGFFFIPKVEKMEKHDFDTDVEKPLSTETDEILTDLLNYLKTTNHKFLFIVSPYIEAKSQKESFNYIERRVTEAGFEFVDFNERYDEMNLNFDTDFYDNNHVNIYGADKYTTLLSKYLKEKYTLPDRRTDINYSNNWNALLYNWHAQVNSTKAIIDEQMKGEQ